MSIRRVSFAMSRSAEKLALGRPPGKLAEWFDELRDPLRRFLAVRRGIKTCDIDDLAQEVFLRLLRYDRAELINDPKAYLFKMANNVACEWFSYARQRLPHASEWLSEAPVTAGPEESWEQERRQMELNAALQTLSPRAREVLRLHFHEELTYESIAERMRVSRRVVKREIIRAYSALRAALDDERSRTARNRARGAAQS